MEEIRFDACFLMIRFWDFSLYFTERVTNVLVEFDVRGKQGMGFFIIRDYELIFWPDVMV